MGKQRWQAEGRVDSDWSIQGSNMEEAALEFDLEWLETCTVWSKGQGSLSEGESWADSGSGELRIYFREQ